MAGAGETEGVVEKAAGAGGSRKERPRLALDPSQPPTTQGKPRARVFLACAQCRKRKIRCDGAKPTCYNCTQRNADGECSYDAAPRRRGPDRVQGARTRSSKLSAGADGPAPKRRRRRKDDHDRVEDGGTHDGGAVEYTLGDDLGLGSMGDGDWVLGAMGSMHTEAPGRGYASSAEASSLSPASIAGSSALPPLPASAHVATPVQTQFPMLHHRTPLTIPGQNHMGLSVNTQAPYSAHTSRREPGSATFGQETAGMFWGPGPAGTTYAADLASPVSAVSSREPASAFFGYEPGLLSSAIPQLATEFASEGFTVPSQRLDSMYIPSQYGSVRGNHAEGSSAHDRSGSSKYAASGYPVPSPTQDTFASAHIPTEFAGRSYANGASLPHEPAFDYEYAIPGARASRHSAHAAAAQQLYHHSQSAEHASASEDRAWRMLTGNEQRGRSQSTHRQEHAHAPTRALQTTPAFNGSAFAGTSYALPLAFFDDVRDDTDEQSRSVSAEPSLEFTRQTWWDGLLTIYASALPAVQASSYDNQLQTTEVRLDMRGAKAAILADVRFLFSVVPHWFFFLHPPTFYAALARPESACPALVLAVLAVSALFQSDIGSGETGRQRALRLRDEAQSALEAALGARSLSEELAGAAWVIAFFEQCCHPAHKHTRVRGALHILDALSGLLRLPTLDSDNPTASAYEQGEVPVVRSGIEEVPTDTVDGAGESYSAKIPRSTNTTTTPPVANRRQQQRQSLQPLIHAHASAQSEAARSRATPCSCDVFTLGRVDPQAGQHTQFWLTNTPAWQNTWSPSEIRREGSRRLAWSAMTLAAAYSSYAAAAGFTMPNLALLAPENFNLLFPGEPLGTGKSSVWALYLRAMLLWLACLRMRERVDKDKAKGLSSESEGEVAAFAMAAWLETEAIEETLNTHSCGVEAASLYHGREYLFNTRMCISFEFRRFIPHVIAGVGKEKSTEWLRHQGRRAKLAAHSLQAVSGSRGHSLAQRPHFVWWFMGQVRRALQLWTLDHSLTVALDVCRDFMLPIEYLTKIFPCPEQRARVNELRNALAQATLEATQLGYTPPRS